MALGIFPDMPFSGLAARALQSGPENGIDEALVAGRIVQQDKIRTAFIPRRIENLAIGVDLQHEQLAVSIHADIAAAVSRAAQPHEELPGNFFQAAGQKWIIHGNTRHALVVPPLEIEMLKRFAARKQKLHRLIDQRRKFIVGILRHQRRELPAFDELLDQRVAKGIHGFGHLNPQIFGSLHARMLRDADARISARMLHDQRKAQRSGGSFHATRVRGKSMCRTRDVRVMANPLHGLARGFVKPGRGAGKRHLQPFQNLDHFDARPVFIP